MRKSAIILTVIGVLMAAPGRAVGFEKASNPSPPDNSTVPSEEVTVSWTPPDYATLHCVYFGTDFNDVNDCGFPVCEGIFKGCQTATSYYVGPVLLSQRCYWRIDELGPGAYAKGDVWSYSVPEYVSVDDMESYDNNTNYMWDTWLDGCGDINGVGNGTGSCIWLEEGTVHGGGKSMLYTYNNSGQFPRKAYSEARRTFAPPENWTDNGEKALTLWFHGNSQNDSEPMYVALGDGSVYVVRRYGDLGEDANDITREEWREWNLRLADFNEGGLNVSNIVNLAIGFGDRDNPQPGGSGVMYFDEIVLYPSRCMLREGRSFGDTNGDCAVDGADLVVLGNCWLEDHRFGQDAGPPVRPPLKGDVSPSEGQLKTGFTLMTKDYYGDVSGPITWTNFGSSGIDLTLETGDSTSLAGADSNGERLSCDSFLAYGKSGSPEADLILTLGNLWPGDYILTTYHNNPDSNASTISSVDVNGAVSTSVGDINVIQTNDTYDANCGSSRVAFAATGKGDVVVRYTVGNNEQVWFNGFVLEYIGAPAKPYHPSPSDGAENVGTNVVLRWYEGDAPVEPAYGEPIVGTIDTGTAASDAYDYLLGTSTFNLGPASGGGRIIGTVSNLAFGTSGDSNNGSWLEIGFIAKKRADYSISHNNPQAMFSQSAFLLACQTTAGNLLVMPADTNTNWVPALGGPGGGGGDDGEYFDLGTGATCFWFILDIIPEESGAGGDIALKVIGQSGSRTWKYGYDDWDWVDWKTNGTEDPGIKEFYEAFEPVYVIAQGYANKSGGSAYAEISMTARQLVRNNNLILAAPTMYVKPGEPAVINMEAVKLSQKVVGCQAVLGYSSTHLRARQGCVVPGDDPWHELIYNSWDIPGAGVHGEIDTAIGINLEAPTGTDADGTVAKITLTALMEGTTQIVFRPDVNDVENTVFADMNATPIFPNKLNSQTIIISYDSPVFDVYFGDDWEAVSDANETSSEYRATVNASEYDAGASESLELFKTYYWRIDQPVGSGVIKGDVWTFTTGCAGERPLEADFYGDCMINFKDYAILASWWLVELHWP